MRLAVLHVLRLAGRRWSCCSRRSTSSSSPASGSTRACASCAELPRAATSRHVPRSGKYTAAAYLVVFVAVLRVRLIIAAKLQRLEREVGELVELARERGDDG